MGFIQDELQLAFGVRHHRTAYAQESGASSMTNCMGRSLSEEEPMIKGFELHAHLEFFLNTHA